MHWWKTANTATWLATLAEVAVGVWLTGHYPIAGGVVIGAAMGCQYARIMNGFGNAKG
jgi:hypothetical protein